MSISSRITYCISRVTPNADLLIAPFVFCATFALYLQTMAPTLGGGHDSAEFQHVAYTLGIAHPTGYPLYLILGKIATTLLPLGHVAYRMNLLSVLFSALAAVFVYLSIVLLTQHRWSALIATALFVTNIAVWRQGGVASVSPLNLLLFAALMYTLLHWQLQGARLEPVALVLGLGLAHHRSIILLCPAIAVLLLLNDFKSMRHPREWIRWGIALGTPLLLYLYLPLFGNNSPWYSNTFEGFFTQIAAGEVGAYMRTTFNDLADAFGTLVQFLFDSFGILGWSVIALGIVRFVPRSNHQTKRLAIFLSIATLTYVVWTTLFDSEQDRYFALPFFFLVYWFALGSAYIEEILTQWRTARACALCLLLGVLISIPFSERWRTADWSRYDREYALWNEVFTLPIPTRATLVGDWRQLNAMRYMQRIENRRTDLQFVGTMYDPTPQTDAARAAFADGRAIFLAPGVALPLGEYRYAQLGPLLEVRDAPQTQPPATLKNIALTPALTLADFGVTPALESYAPLTHIAPNRTARVTLVWSVQDRIADFLVRMRVYDVEGHTIALKDEPPVRGLYPPTRWSRGEYVRSVHNILIPAGTPPGTYRLTMQTLNSETQLPTSEEITLTAFVVERSTNLTRDQVFIARSLTFALNDSIELWGYGGFESTLRAGETVRGNLVFFARRNVGVEHTLTFALRDGKGNIVQTWTRAPIAFYPTREWQRGEILKAYYTLPLAPDLSAGAYTLAVGLDTLHNLVPIQVVR